MTTMALEAELRYFDEHREELVQAHLDKFVVIKGERLAGSYDTAQGAYEAAVAEFGPTEAFLLKRVLPEDPIAQAPAVYTGLITLGR